MSRLWEAIKLTSSILYAFILLFFMVTFYLTWCTVSLITNRLYRKEKMEV